MNDNQILDLELFRDYAEGVLGSLGSDSGEQYCMIWLHLKGYEVFRRQRGLFRGKELVDAFGALLLTCFSSGLVGHAEADDYLVLSDCKEVELAVMDLNTSLLRQYADARVMAEAGVCIIGGQDGSRDSMKTLVEKAQQALRSLDGNSDQRVAYYSESMDRSIRLNSYVPHHLQEAIEKHYIHVLYQPIVRTLTGQICGAEALARWDDPVMGPISPGEFVPILEQRHMSHLLDACIVELVAEDFEACGENNAGALVPVSVNLSRYDFEDCDIFEVFEKAVREHNLPPSLFRLELSEGALTVSHDLLKNELERFRDAGYEVWLDNFGSGYASMSVLGEFHFDAVKFDLHLMRSLRASGKNGGAAIMLQYTVNMIKEMKMTSAIVGVETEEEYHWLRQHGFEMQQGFYFGRPQTYGGIIGSDRQIEDYRSRDYFSRVGAVQIDNRTMGGNQSHAADPMAIIEKRGEDLELLVANQAMETFVQGYGFQNAEDFARRMYRASGAMQERMRDFLDTVAEGGQNVLLTLWTGGRIMDFQGSLLAKDPERNSMAIMLQASMIVESEKNRGQDLRDMLRVIYTVYDRMDLVSRTEHLVERSFLNAPDYGIMIEGRDYDMAVRLFAKEVIRRRDQDRFIQFMDESTVDERLQTENRLILLDAFEVKKRSGGYVNKAFIIIPMTTRGQKAMLIAMRDMMRTEETCIR